VPAATLVARSAAAEIQAHGLARIGAGVQGSLGPAAYPVAEPYVNGHSEGGIGRLAGRMLSAFFRKRGLPAWKARQFHRTARESRLLDPDLAALRSLSPSAIMRLQWRRNEERLIELYLNRFEEESERREFEEKHNTDYLG
jgi:hypothetical protein